MNLNEITIEVTQRCPNRCIYCSSFSDTTKSKYLDFDTICRVVDDAKSLGTKSVSLSGGEPLLHPDIVNITDYIHAQGLNCLLYTSGIVLAEDGIPTSVPSEVLEKIKGTISKLIVNIESSDEETYNIIMGTNFGGFSLMQTTIRNARERGIAIEAHMVPMKVNYLQIPEVIKMCVDLGISQISFLRLVVQGRAQENLQKVLLDTDEYDTAKRLMKEATEYSNIKIRMGVPFRNGTRRINCMTGICKLDVRYDGKVYPCEAFKNNNLMHVGIETDNVNKKSLKEIYLSSAYLIHVRSLLETFQKEKTCETCMNQYYTRKKMI